MFIGNLPSNLEDIDILRNVEAVFRIFGNCEVMVNRKAVPNRQKVPSAFVQFEVCV